MSTLAVVLALGGTAIAANGSISGSTIQIGSLPRNRIKAHTVTGTQVKLSALGKVPKAAKADTAADATHATSATSATTAATASNATHAAAADSATLAANATAFGGAAPSAFLGRTVVVVAHSAPVSVGSFGSADANCPASYEAVGGGVSVNNVIHDLVTGSFPLLTDATNAHDPIFATDGAHTAGNGWRGWVTVNSGGPDTFAVIAVCSKIGP